jgi:hypothetical protein
MEMPASIDKISSYHEVIEGLGIDIARVKRPLESGGPQMSVLNNFNKWARKILPLIRLVIPKYTEFSHLYTMDLLSAWIGHANFKAPEISKVIVTLAKDLANTREWQRLSRRLGPLVVNRGLDFEKLANKGKGQQIVRAQRGKIRYASIYSVDSLTSHKSAAIIKRVNQGINKAKSTLDRLSYPSWTITTGDDTRLLVGEYKKLIRKFYLENADRRKDPESTPHSGLGMPVHVDLNEF